MHQDDDQRRLDLVPLRDAQHLAIYHDLRRRELFERYSPSVRYHPGVADEDAPGNLAHVLLLDGAVIGTIRIDLIDRQHAGLRLVAIMDGYKNRGFGAIMLQRAEAIVAAYGRRSIVVNAARAAAAFYRRHGYHDGDWSDVLAFDPETQERLGKHLRG